MENPYLSLTDEFNRGRLRALLSSGQAVVVHRLAIASKDGDWILRETPETAAHVLDVLASHGARYRFGAPLDPRWLAGGWSSHFEYSADGMRVRTDFVTRPPRLTAEQVRRMWSDAETEHRQVVPVEELAAIKLTDREKDYPVVGELARRMRDPVDQFRYSRSSRDLIALARDHSDALERVVDERPLLRLVSQGRDALDEALDRERRRLMRTNEERLERYRAAAKPWAERWIELQRRVRHLSLAEAHRILLEEADGILPFSPAEASS